MSGWIDLSPPTAPPPTLTTICAGCGALIGVYTNDPTIQEGYECELCVTVVTAEELLAELAAARG